MIQAADVILAELACAVECGLQPGTILAGEIEAVRCAAPRIVERIDESPGNGSGSPAGVYAADNVERCAHIRQRLPEIGRASAPEGIGQILVGAWQPRLPARITMVKRFQQRGSPFYRLMVTTVSRKQPGMTAEKRIKPRSPDRG